MKTIAWVLFLFSTGGLFGYFTRVVIVEDRVRRNLAGLSDGSLSQLEELAEFTDGFSTETIKRKWREYQDFSAAGSDLVALREAWCGWQRAIIFREVERVGWPAYRSLVAQNAAQYLSFRRHGAYGGSSGYAKKEIEKAEEMIHEAIPAKMLESSGH